MTPGPNRILKTPLTGAIVKITTISSGNNLGACYWTDGKCDAPMLPDRPWLRLIPQTGELFWVDECEIVGSEEWGGPRAYPDAPFAGTPEMEDYLRALSDGIASSPEKERYVRMRLWWAANDPVRYGKTPRPSGHGYRENLTELLALLIENDPEQRLMAAEVSRELGDFSRAAELLSFTFPKDFDFVVNRIRSLVEERDPIVRRMR